MKGGKQGFTILEVLAATLLFALSVFAIVQSQGGSQRLTVRSERIFVALTLAETKMAETVLKYQSEIDKNGLEQSFKEESGTFDAPNQDFSWKISLKESSVKFDSEQIGAFMKGLGLDEDEIAKQMDSQRLVITNLAKAIKENFGELIVTVQWKDFGRTETLPLVTHMIPKKPKIELTTVAE